MNTFKILVVLFVLIGLSAYGQAEPVERSAEILDLTGEVMVSSMDGEMIPAEVGMTLTQGDIISTGVDSWAYLSLAGTDTASVELDAGSEMLISELIMDEEAGTQQTLLDLAIGKILITAQKIHSEDSKFQVKTPTSVVGVRGTTFQVEVEAVE